MGLLLPGCCSAVIGGLFLYVHGGAATDCLYNVDGGGEEGWVIKRFTMISPYPHSWCQGKMVFFFI